ncbi:MAG: hypothetical protein NTW21_25240 [Verrucomicrobia bacterium]|nr:hypothetical protein [Verrucomicrobiota bacterium]
MKTATVDDHRHHCASLLSWGHAGEEIDITRRGKPVARAIPDQAAMPPAVNRADRPAVWRDRTGETMLTAGDSSQLIHAAAGKW